LPSIFDLHVHTSRGSADSGLDPEDMFEESKRIGLTGIMVAEHEGWAKYDFEKFADTHDLVLIRGLEVYTPLGHVIAIGLERQVTGFHGGIEQVELLRKTIDDIGGFLILAHPFRFFFDLQGVYSQNILFRDTTNFPQSAEEASSHPVFALMDSIEVVNGGNIDTENRFAQEVANVLGISGTGGSDAHSLQGLGKGSTYFNEDIRNQADLIAALRSNTSIPIEGFHTGKPVSYSSKLLDLNKEIFKVNG
jgi:predicted metal-dependent phosphoesterase TrpH